MILQNVLDNSETHWGKKSIKNSQEKDYAAAKTQRPGVRSKLETYNVWRTVLIRVSLNQ